MKSFKDVFPSEDYDENRYWERPISELEQMFTPTSEYPNEDFFYLCLIVNGIRCRFKQAEVFYKGHEYRLYLRALEKRRKLEVTKPKNGPELISWETAYQKAQNQAEGYEMPMRDIERKLRGELDRWDDVTLPQSFTDYCSLKRLKLHDGSSVPKKKMIELNKVAEAMLEYAPFYYPLLEGHKLFDMTEKLVLIPKVLEADADYREMSLDELAEDAEYINKDLGEFLDDNDAVDIRKYVAADKKERRQKRVEMEQRVKENKRKTAVPPHELYIRYDGHLMAGNTVLVSREDWGHIQDDEKCRLDLKAIIKQYKRSSTRMARPEEGPRKAVTKQLVDDDKLQPLQRAIGEYLQKREKKLAASKQDGEQPTASRSPRGYSSDQLPTEDQGAPFFQDSTKET
jgi:hypothetical protein